MENSQPETPPNKLEVVQMLVVDARSRVDLKGAVVVGRVLEEAVQRVKHLAGQQEEEFSITEVSARFPMREEA